MDSPHQFIPFQKNNIKLFACVRCGEIKTPSNQFDECTRKPLINSRLHRAGWRVAPGEYPRIPYSRAI